MVSLNIYKEEKMKNFEKKKIKVLSLDIFYYFCTSAF
jgi:hypothetical protein